MTNRHKIAVVGSGISGLASAWLLARQHDVTLYEANHYFGGHTNTVDITIDNITAPVDTGFLVHNDLTYPNLIALFNHLGIQTHESNMTFSVAVESAGLEWAGTDLDSVFCQRRNLLRPRFWWMLKDILRFNRHAQTYLNSIPDEHYTLGALLDQHGYGNTMREWYLLPMAAAIWSCSTQSIEAFPAATFLRFCLNHRLLQINDRPPWKTVLHGAREYVNKMLAGIPDARLNCAVTAIKRTPEQVEVHTAQGIEHFDHVVLACHAPTSLNILDCDSEERKILRAFHTQPNLAVLHMDASLLPVNQKAWAAWNYTMPVRHRPQYPVTVSYLLNRLQPLPWHQPVLVTLNPHVDIQEDKVLAQFEYAHPIMDAAAIAAQRALNDIQGRNRAWFCGAWSGYGFHEDGLKSALRVALALGVEPPWQAVYD
ncbi:NAD(P)/FAD-dependent oxidoreductase [Methylobacillus sp. Pita2]|uniref:NAD(P)/FAD-dependent oxidoreductase n=1 Tax=Methylobacillus sp. Pita2 TaxID=3383245 RepID=UPI0038B5C681